MTIPFSSVPGGFCVLNRKDEHWIVIDHENVKDRLGQMLRFPNLGGGTGNQRGIHFEDAIQSYIDASPWKPSDELRAMRQVHLLRRGDGKNNQITDIDAIGESGDTLLIVSCKAVIFSVGQDIGEYHVLKYARPHHKIAYEDIIHAAGHRVTPQRLFILDAVCEGGGHTTLGEVYARVRQVDQSIDRSTLYRTLKLFVELGLVVSADTGNGETYYEIAKAHPHHHLKCRRCGKEQEIEHAVMQRMFDQVLQEYRFKVDTDHLVLFGVCADCQHVQDAKYTP